MAYHPCWRGRLRALAITFPTARDATARFERIEVSGSLDAKPFLYLRDLAPGRALLCVGREEKVLAVLRNLGGKAREVTVALGLPDELEAVDGATRSVGDLAGGATHMVEWRIRARAPGVREATVRTTARGFGPIENRLELPFTPRPDVPPADYVPPPRPAKSRYLSLMHYCPLWKLGTHYGWNRIEPWPGRRPAIGFYDEGTPEVADWHIKIALEHGIQGFIYCWYRKSLEPQIEQTLAHAIHDGLLEARYLNKFRFCIMWENGCAKGVKDRDDMMQNLLPYWIETYFTHPSYLKIDDKPVLFVWRPERVSPQLGGVEGTRAVFDEMREACRRRGLDGLWLIGCVSSANRELLERMAQEGWDASSAYAVGGRKSETLGRDEEGLTAVSHESFMRSQEDVWRGKKAIGALPDIPTVMMGWDSRPWHGNRSGSYTTQIKVRNFEDACLAARGLIEATPGNGPDKRIVVFDNWNEFGEGHYLEPCSAFGFGFVDAIRRVFCDSPEPCVDITPEDVGLQKPEHAYRSYRRILFGDGPVEKRQPKGDLVAWWRFEGDDDYVAIDSSGCRFNGVKRLFESAGGVEGKGYRTGRGAVSLRSHELLYPLTGITVELWYRTEIADQTDKWMLNAVGGSDTGYRLGLSEGRLMWQVPQTAWSHGLRGPEPAPLGRWTHVAATYDNDLLRLYVDGVEKGTLRRGGAIRPGGGNLCIGAYAESGHAAFAGVLDEVRVYRRALAAEEVRRCFEVVRPR